MVHLGLPSIKILSVCVSVRYGSRMFGGQDKTSDARPSYLYFVLCVRNHKCWSGWGWGQQLKQMQFERSSWSGCNLGAAAEVDAIREQQLKWMESGSSSWSGCKWGTATEADAIGEQQLKQMQRSAVEADGIGEQPLKRIQLGRSRYNQGTAAELDAVGEQQLKWTKPFLSGNCTPGRLFL